MKRVFPPYFVLALLLSGLSLPASAWALPAEESGKAIKALSEHAASMDMVWTLLASFLIFLMQAGFTLVEVGFTRAKNAGNVVMKNMIDFALGSIGFFFIGYGLMFGASAFGLFGTSDFFLEPHHPLGESGQLEVRQPDVPGGIRRNGGDHRLRGHERAGQIHRLPLLQPPHQHPHLSRRGTLDLGGRVAGPHGHDRLLRVHGGSLRGRVGFPGRRSRPGPPPGPLQPRRVGECHPRAQHSPGRPGGLHPLVRVVRVQHREHPLRHQPEHRPDRGKHDPGRGRAGRSAPWR